MTWSSMMEIRIIFYRDDPYSFPFQRKPRFEIISKKLISSLPTLNGHLSFTDYRYIYLCSLNDDIRNGKCITSGGEV